jgi:hypothetical protein
MNSRIASGTSSRSTARKPSPPPATDFSGHLRRVNARPNLLSFRSCGGRTFTFSTMPPMFLADRSSLAAKVQLASGGYRGRSARARENPATSVMNIHGSKARTECHTRQIRFRRRESARERPWPEPPGRSGAATVSERRPAVRWRHLRRGYERARPRRSRTPSSSR